MKKIAIVLFLLSVSVSFAFGQTSSDSILIKKVYCGYEFYQGDQKLTLNKLAKIMEPNEQASRLIKSAQSNSTIAMILGYTGGFLIGWPIGTIVSGGDPYWLMAGVGLGIIIIRIPISKSAVKKTKHAVEMYNAGLQTSSFWDKNELKLSVTENGIGLVLKF
ncbi:MAG: hypothetical protein ACOXZ9_05620 [Bacteroidales bacterium]|jgi:hypothetical protein